MIRFFQHLIYLSALLSAGVVQAGPIFEKDIQPLLEKCCYRCHGEEKIKGDLDLTTYHTKESVFADRDIWLDVHEQIETEEMPTKGALPTNAERVLIMEWIQATLNEVDWSQVKHAGHVRMPLLNNKRIQ